ncbi:OLC1v1013170C1 [Oldenlandia corymbosa var. corymbosa]|uniref:OLC1v1013170C1 n=1 Tax=Oldenlandia corymbosa var. corymbosa TaxID=529605 RepID=A0AAV1E0Y8_OLDCO|nr:OLC1v1013170C1 [Oldenlandia corymbosa var. corymbosa]
MGGYKLFLGGISWHTDEDRLREYFTRYGEVVEAVVMRNPKTGGARGFGFVVFADPEAAESAVVDKQHMIDGRTVEAKTAFPRVEKQQPVITNTNNTNSSSLIPGRTKKVFVGGLESTVRESELKKYFEQYGGIKDVAVMRDPNTRKPRGFGFVTYHSEDAVELVLRRTFHLLNGKMVEVQRAVPKQPTPPPMPPSGRPNSYSPSPLVGYTNHGYYNRPDDFLTGFRMEDNLGIRTGLSQFGYPDGYGMGVNLDPGLSPPRFREVLGFNDNGKVLRPYFGGNYNTPPPPLGLNTDSFSGSRGDSTILLGSYLGSGRSGGSGSRVYGESTYGLGSGSGGIGRSGSAFGDPDWQFAASDHQVGGTGFFGYGVGNSSPQDFEGIVGSYSTIANRQSNGGIAA